MAAAFSTAMLVSLRWVRGGSRRVLMPAAALLGLAVLAKGLVPLVLAAPLAWMGRKRIADLLRPAVVASFLAVALPWYLLCYARNGYRFIEVFFVEHQFGRFASEALGHPQPFWFYVPVVLAALFPWTPGAIRFSANACIRRQEPVFSWVGSSSAWSSSRSRRTNCRATFFRCFPPWPDSWATRRLRGRTRPRQGGPVRACRRRPVSHAGPGDIRDSAASPRPRYFPGNVAAVRGLVDAAPAAGGRYMDPRFTRQAGFGAGVAVLWRGRRRTFHQSAGLSSNRRGGVRTAALARRSASPE